MVALLLLAVFTTAVARLLARGERPVCSCFGATSATPISRWTIVRNTALMVIAALTAWAQWRAPGCRRGCRATAQPGSRWPRGSWVC